MKTVFTFIIVAILATSCCRPSHNYNIAGPCEFVTDSYRIRQGKQAIQEMMGIQIAEMPDGSLQEEPNVIREGDVFNILVYHPKRSDLTKAYEFISEKMGGFKVVNNEVTLPDTGPIRVTGMSISKAREKIEIRLREDIEDITVYLSAKDRLRYSVTLIGKVSTDHVPIDGRMRIYDVLAKAKVPNDANYFMSYVERDGEQLPIDMYRLVHEGDMSQNIVMKGGDKIFIAAAADSVVHVLGEVNNPTQIPVPRGSITLIDALAVAKGIPFTGDNCRIQVIRGDLQCPKIYVLSWNHVINLPNDSLLLMPGDTVYVSAKPITQWNRFMSQIVPCCGWVQGFWGVYGLFR